jgi:hypothetical protein
MPTILKGGLSSANASTWMTSTFMKWLPLVSIALSTSLNLGKDIGFFIWARRTLYDSFRAQATRSLSPVQYAAPPLVPAPIPTPPVIPLQQ